MMMMMMRSLLALVKKKWEPRWNGFHKIIWRERNIVSSGRDGRKLASGRFAPFFLNCLMGCSGVQRRSAARVPPRKAQRRTVRTYVYVPGRNFGFDQPARD